jgi:hypothetical protein
VRGCVGDVVALLPCRERKKRATEAARMEAIGRQVGPLILLIGAPPLLQHYDHVLVHLAHGGTTPRTSDPSVIHSKIC